MEPASLEARVTTTVVAVKASPQNKIKGQCSSRDTHEKQNKCKQPKDFQRAVRTHKTIRAPSSRLRKSRVKRHEVNHHKTIAPHPPTPTLHRKGGRCGIKCTQASATIRAAVAKKTKKPLGYQNPNTKQFITVTYPLNNRHPGRVISVSRQCNRWGSSLGSCAE